jgi:hypothetical protein
MAYADLNSVQNPTLGATVQVAWGDQARDNDEALRKPKFAYVNNGYETISDNNTTTVTFANQVHDVGALFTPGDTFVTFVDSGLYVITVTAEWDTAIGGRRQIEVIKNVSTSLGHVTGPAGPAGDAAQSIVIPLQAFTAAETVHVDVYQDSGVSLQVLVGMSVHMVGTL